jgi:hypothetical protein
MALLLVKRVALCRTQVQSKLSKAANPIGPQQAEKFEMIKFDLERSLLLYSWMVYRHQFVGSSLGREHMVPDTQNSRHNSATYKTMSWVRESMWAPLENNPWRTVT